jgi:hypothetical protein
VKADIEQEMRAEELKRVLEDQAKHNPLEEIVEETRQVARDIDRDKDAGEAQGEDRSTPGGPAQVIPKQPDEPK